MEEKKLKQLKRVFKKMLRHLIKSVDARHGYKDEKLNEILANEYTNNLLYEVKIRINNK